MVKISAERVFEARPEVLWEIIVDPDFYRFWTRGFNPGSDFEGGWDQGDKICFFAQEGDGLRSGMVSEIEVSNWPECISVKHLGLLLNGVEDYDSPVTKKWTPAYENYDFVRLDQRRTAFVVEQDLPEEEADYFKAAWEKSFDLIQELLVQNPSVGKVITLRQGSHRTVSEIWTRLTQPNQVMTWNFASDDWHCPSATLDLRIGGEFHFEMAARDGSMSFDYWGTFDVIEPNRSLHYTLGDGRKVAIDLFEGNGGCLIEERFEADQEGSLNLQRRGWQNILKNLS